MAKIITVSYSRKKKSQARHGSWAWWLNAFNPSTWENKAHLCEIEARLIYIASTRAAGAIGKPCLKRTPTSHKRAGVLLGFDIMLVVSRGKEAGKEARQRFIRLSI